MCASMTYPVNLSLSEAARRIAAGRLTAEALVSACLEKIQALEPEIRAWAHVDAKAALLRARQCDQQSARGGVHGIPFGAKDNIDSFDMPTEHGSIVYEGHRPAADASCVALARERGAILLGKTTTSEFAHVTPGATANPRDPARIPGISSSGSAAAVAAYMVPVAIGTQTGGSIIRPASYCGVIGYKATYGDFSLSGVKENTGSLDTLGFFVRDISDVAVFRAAMLGTQPTTCAEVSLADLRIGFCRTPFWDQAEDSLRSQLETAVSHLSSGKARVRDITLGEDAVQFVEALRSISAFEFSRALAHERIHHGNRLSAALRSGRMHDGLNCSYEKYVEACGIAEKFRGDLDCMSADCDVLVTPACTGEAPVGPPAKESPVFNTIWTGSHRPAVSLPVFAGPSGLPMGLQVVGHRHQDEKLIECAAAILRALG